MADEGTVCVCPQCGKKYKLKGGFEAKSFSCKGCGATVWVAGKPPAPAPTAKGAGAALAVASKGGRGGRGAPSSGALRRSRGHGHAEEAEGGRRGRGREKPKSSTKLLIAIGAVAVIGIVVVVAVMSGKDKGDTGPGGTTQAPGLAASTAGTPPAPDKPAPKPPDTAQPKPPVGAPAENPEGEEPEAAPSPEGGEKPRLGGGKKPDGAGKYDPPATLGHLETTPPEQRKQIDELIALMFDVQAGRESHDAKAKLAAIGKPAFLPVLGKMAVIRDTITDEDSMPERLIESSLMLADGCLREMDGFLEASGKQVIRPGTDKKYIKYILLLHYRRWNDGMGSRPLKDMETMPGAFDASKLPPDSGEEDEEAGK